MKNSFLFLTGALLCFNSFAQTDVEEYYLRNLDNKHPSQSHGTVSNGSITNSKLFPFSGNNFQYFDTLSYLKGRAFLNGKVKKTLLNTYKILETENANRLFFVMECSHEKGGKLYPHRTHQNGLSVDFMMPLLKDKDAYYKLDTIGINHYWLDFDNQGRYSKNKNVSIDFNLVAQHILLLNQEAKKQGLMIKKVIINTSLKDELFATKYGTKLKNSGIYIVKSLSPLINSLHDDHYHIDFGK